MLKRIAGHILTYCEWVLILMVAVVGYVQINKVIARVGGM